MCSFTIWKSKKSIVINAGCVKVVLLYELIWIPPQAISWRTLLSFNGNPPNNFPIKLCSPKKIQEPHTIHITNDRTYFHGPPVANVLHQVVDFWASLFRMHWCALHPINALYADVTLIEKPKNKFTPKKEVFCPKRKKLVELKKTLFRCNLPVLGRVVSTSKNVFIPILRYFFELAKKLHVGVSTNRGSPKWMVYNGKPY